LGLRARYRRDATGTSVHSKALAIFPRTPRSWNGGARWSFLDTEKVTSVCVSHRRQLAHMRFAPEESPYPIIAIVPRNITESCSWALGRRDRAVDTTPPSFRQWSATAR
jgi:hypothetical protein